jgi:alkanesulfonate monooxygenase SsuD/methylene tetrahydromethanopterin reductase-like flavin-dependent oxidoreductase (luciferase family)
MRFGVILPNLGVGGDVLRLVDLAVRAEHAGWDAVLVWDSVFSPGWHEEYEGQPERQATCDPWLALAAIAVRTRRVVLGPMVTPPARRRPWKLAREVVTLDHLSAGRAVLPVALGAPDDGAFALVGEPIDRRTRAERLDESLAILTGLWSGEPFAFQGRHYRTAAMTFLPRPLQQPRVPVWVVAGWPRRRSMRRALRYDGIIPVRIADDGALSVMRPADIAQLRADLPSDRRYEVVVQARAAGRAEAPLYAEAGATMWLQDVWQDMLAARAPKDIDVVQEQIAEGPPRT